MAYVFLNIYLVVTLLVHYTHGGSLCLSCRNVPESTDCRFTQTCSYHEVCYMDSYVTPNGAVVTDVGCRDTHLCQSTQGRRSLNETRDVRSSNNVLVCSDCCQGDLCNSALCGQSGYGARSTRGPLCYDCTNQHSISSCNEVVQCAIHEECIVSASLITSPPSIRYNSGCESKRYCDAFRMNEVVGRKRFQKRGFACTHCCNTDLCNNRCEETNVTTTTTTTAITTTASALSNACSSNPCMNGNCSLYQTTYICTCYDGFTGRNCEHGHQSINPCLLNPCVHGVCTTHAGVYACACRTGYYGVNCDKYSG